MSQPPLLPGLDAPEIRPASSDRRSPPARRAPRERTQQPSESRRLADVVVPTPVDHLFTYRVPTQIAPSCLPGARVVVPFAGRMLVGLVWAVRDVDDTPLPRGLKAIAELVDAGPLFGVSDRAFLDFVARYYHAPLGEVLRVALPSAARRTGLDEDLGAAREVEVIVTVDRDAVAMPPDPPLRKPERRIVDAVRAEREIDATELRRRMPAPARVLVDLAARGHLTIERRRVFRDPLGLRSEVPRDTPPVLTPEQRLAVDAIVAPAQQGWAGVLLHGVTGSGKTEVYLHVIAEALARGRGAIVLVPEIALTPQLVQRFRARFGDEVATLHSAMTEGERLDQWTRLRDGARRIVIGPRSALFAPVRDLGLVVVDEEHDGSFKQASGLRYNARDLALVRARDAGAVAVLGSATPSLEMLRLASTGRLRHLMLRERATGSRLAHVDVIDLRTADRLWDPELDGPGMLSEALVSALHHTIARGEQAMLLLNRRGWSGALVCARCGDAIECDACAVSMAFHRRDAVLRCHYCDTSIDVPTVCPGCGGGPLVPVGAGTERAEQRLIDALPGLRIARFDRDTARGKRLFDTLDAFRQGRLDVLVGTQMLAKGHDFPKVTLVGVLLAETGLRVPDFRAAERTFQLIVQVSGRAGRHEAPGRVIVQTFAPDHPAIRCAAMCDHDAFVAEDLAARRAGRYPPFAHLALVEISSAKQQAGLDAIREVASVLARDGLEVRGPVRASLPRLRGEFRFHVIARSEARAPLHAALGRLTKGFDARKHAHVRLIVDVDPQSLI